MKTVVLKTVVLIDGVEYAVSQEDHSGVIEHAVRHGMIEGTAAEIVSWFKTQEQDRANDFNA